MVMENMKRLLLGFSAVLLMAIVISLLCSPKADAGYDRFKTVGVDSVKHGFDITVIQDKKTGCFYGQIGNSTYTQQMFPIMDYANRQDCEK